jgi:hypothetical protein
LTIFNNSSNDSVVMPVALTILPTSAENPNESIVTEYSLSQNYPNPFNGVTNFRFDLKYPGMTSLKIFNMLGQEVVTVMNEVREAGTHQVNFDMGNLASGLYLYRLESGSFSETRKLMLLK